MIITALISEPGKHGFTIRQMEETDILKLVGYAQVLCGMDWSVFIDEEAKFKTDQVVNNLSTVYLDQLKPGFSRRDCIVGTAVWTGGAKDANSTSVTAETVTDFAQLVLSAASTLAPITVVRWENDVYVYDSGFSEILGRIDSFLTAADQASRDGDNFGVIEVTSNITAAAWPETGTAAGIKLHDRRTTVGG